MLFGEKLKTLRKTANISQNVLAEQLGVSKRTIINYESGRCYPKQTEVFNKMAGIFGVNVDYLMSEEEEFVQEVKDEYGFRAKTKAEKLISDSAALFAGGELDDSDKELVYKAITELFWETREANKKFTPKKFRKT